MKSRILSDCKNAKRNKIIGMIVTVIIILISISVVMCRIASDKKAQLYTPPSFETNVLKGVPTPDAKYSFGVFKSKYDFSIGLCAIPEYKDNSLDIYFTNPLTNNVWLMLVVSDASTNAELGKSGIIKPGEYVKSISMSGITDQSSISVSILAFEPETYISEGQIDLTNLQTQ